MAEVVGHKVGALFLVGGLGAFGAVLPYVFKKKAFESAIVLMNAFAGGAFIGLALMHLLDEASYLMREAAIGIQFSESWYNLSQLLCFLGFALLLFIEHAVNLPSCVITEPDVKSLESLSTNESASGDANKAELTPFERVNSKRESLDALPAGVARVEPPAALVPAINEGSDAESQVLEFGVPPTSAVEPQIPKKHFSPRAFAALLALSIHAIFEGMVVGFSHSPLEVWMATISIAGHKWAESFALACAFIEQKITLTASVIYLVAFILMTPIGLIVGMFAGEAGPGPAGVCNSLAAGTVIYVGAEMTLEVFNRPPAKHANGKAKKRQSGLVKFLFFSMGACLLLIMALIHHAAGHHPHDHEHDHRRVLYSA